MWGTLSLGIALWISVDGMELVERTRSTGTVQQVPINDSGLTIAPPSPIPARVSRKAQMPESSFSARAPSEDALPPMSLGSSDPTVRQMVNDIKVCPAELAGKRGAEPSQVLAGTIELRWTVSPLGAVLEAEVAALSPTDADILSCAKRKVMQTNFGVVETDPPRRNVPTRLTTEVPLSEG